MPVTERLMLPGAWSLQLIPTTPYAVRSLLKFFGHVVIMDTALDPRNLTDASVLAAARYTGIVRRRDTPYDLSGPGLVAYLGDDNGKGAVYEAAQTLTNGTFGGWITKLLPASLAAGTVTAIAGALTATYTWVTPRDALKNVMEYFGGEYRVRPNANFDAGPSSALFKVTPTAVVQRHGGRDLAVTGIHAPQVNIEQDADDYSTRVVMSATGQTVPGFAANAPSNPYKDLRGNALALTRIVSEPNTPVATAQTNCNAQAALWGVTQRQVTLTSDNYDIGRDVVVGDNVWVFDPVGEIYDTTQQVNYRGEWITPMVLRCLAMTWPVERGLGIYYRDPTTSPATYTDLTPYVVPEPPGVTFEVGAAARKLGG